MGRPAAEAVTGANGVLRASCTVEMEGTGITGLGRRGRSVRGGKESLYRLPPGLARWVSEQRETVGETVVAGVEEGAIVGAMAVSAPLRPEASFVR